MSNSSSRSGDATPGSKEVRPDAADQTDGRSTGAPSGRASEHAPDRAPDRTPDRAPDRAPERRLDFQTYGDRSLPALTLLHAGGMTHQEWQKFTEDFAEKFFVITPTALGHGASPTVDSLSFRSMSRAVLDLLDELGIERSHFLGSSMGGATAGYIALTAPERVDRLVLYRTNFRSDPSMETSLEAMTDPETWRGWGLESFMRQQHEPQGGPDAWLQVTRRVIDMVMSEKQILIDESDLDKVQSPTLIICGDRDPLVPLRDAMLMYERIPKSALWVVPDATHVLQIDTLRRDAFTSEVLNWLA